MPICLLASPCGGLAGSCNLRSRPWLCLAGSRNLLARPCGCVDPHLVDAGLLPHVSLQSLQSGTRPLHIQRVRHRLHLQTEMMFAFLSLSSDCCNCGDNGQELCVC